MSVRGQEAVRKYWRTVDASEKRRRVELLCVGRRISIPAGACFGRWTVMQGVVRLNLKCLCRCVCGVERLVLGRTLNRGESLSCGCWRRELQRKNICLEEGRAVRNSVLSRYMINARKHDREWALTGNQFDTLIARPCHYCGIEHGNLRKSYNSSGDLFYNGLDRKDSDQGYTLENVVPCCAICNRAKSDTPYADFLVWIQRLVDRRR